MGSLLVPRPRALSFTKLQKFGPGAHGAKLAPGEPWVFPGFLEVPWASTCFPGLLRASPRFPRLPPGSLGFPAVPWATVGPVGPMGPWVNFKAIRF